MKNTIKSAREISLLFDTGIRIHGKSVVVLITPVGTVTPNNMFDDERGLSGRVAFIAGKKLGSAPQRSRAKRLMREAARATQAPWRGADTVFLAKRGILLANTFDVIKDMNTIKRKYFETSVS